VNTDKTRPIVMPIPIAHLM